MTTKSVSDENLLRREYYNANNFSVIFELMSGMVEYIRLNKIMLGPQFYTLEPNSWVILPHGYYTATGKGVPQGEPLNLLASFGDNIGKRQTLPSLPFVEPKKY